MFLLDGKKVYRYEIEMEKCRVADKATSVPNLKRSVSNIFRKSFDYHLKNVAITRFIILMFEI